MNAPNKESYEDIRDKEWAAYWYAHVSQNEDEMPPQKKDFYRGYDAATEESKQHTDTLAAQVCTLMQHLEAEKAKSQKLVRAAKEWLGGTEDGCHCGYFEGNDYSVCPKCLVEKYILEYENEA